MSLSVNDRPDPGLPASEPPPAPLKARGRVLPSPISGQELVLIAVIAVLWVILAFATPAFFTAGSIQPLLVSTAPIALVGIGMTIIIITGGIDVSVGAAIMVCSVITAKLLVDQGLSLPLAVLVSVIVGALLGAVNGLLIAYGRVHAIIITFGTANVFLFLGLQIFGSNTVNGIPQTFDFFGRGVAGRTLGIPHAFLITIIIAGIAWWYLRHTAGGRHFYAIGGDAHAARLAGVRVQRRILLAYVITGLLVGLGSCFVIAQGTSTLDQSVGTGKELAVIAAVVIGGTSIMGGRGSVLGTLLGALLVQTVTSGVTQLGWNSQLSDLFVGIFIIIAVGADLIRERAKESDMSATVTDNAPAQDPKPKAGPAAESLGSRLLRALLTQRIVLLSVLIVVVVVVFFIMDSGGYLTAPYDTDYMSSSLINAVPLVMLGLAELLVILSGRGGIDLSVGAIVSLAGMVFGFAYGQWGWPLWFAIILTAAFGGLCGALNGFLVAYIGFPALIATLATYYAFKSLAIVINSQRPISTPPIQELFSITRSVELPVIGGQLPNVPLGIFTFLIPTVVVVWLLLARTTYGRRLYATGTNDVAAKWSGLPVRDTRFKAYVYAGVISGLVAVVTVGQFASARPDAGVSGSGMALPAITIAVLGGVAITGGIGRVAGVVLATLLIVWLNAGILLAFIGNEGSQYQLLALGSVLIFAALLNGITNRRYGGSR